MKLKIVFLLIFTVCAVCAQTPLQYSAVIKTPNISADQSFKNVELWLVNSFDNPDKVIQMNDFNSKRIVFKASAVYQSVKRNVGDINGHIDYVVNLFFRDGRMKVQMLSFTHVAKNDNYSFGTLTDVDYPDIHISFASKKFKTFVYQEMKDRAELEWNTIYRCINAAANSVSATDDDDW